MKALVRVDAGVAVDRADLVDLAHRAAAPWLPHHPPQPLPVGRIRRPERIGEVAPADVVGWPASGATTLTTLC